MYHFELTPFKRSGNPVQEWEKEVEKIFDGFGTDARFSPPCEIIEDDKAFTLSLDVPGLRREDLDIEVRDNQLYITGERKFENRSEKSNVVRSELRYGKFSRVFTLPLHVKAEAISARFENGVLDLSIPKEEKSQPKKITISDWKKEEVLTDLKN
jgi:HSP20 family protein